jgi:hypothetical protein
MIMSAKAEKSPVLNVNRPGEWMYFHGHGLKHSQDRNAYLRSLKSEVDAAAPDMLPDLKDCYLARVIDISGTRMPLI